MLIFGLTSSVSGEPAGLCGRVMCTYVVWGRIGAICRLL